jgi:hypothetical protein
MRVVMIIKISLDGGCTWTTAPVGVRVSMQDLDVPGEYEPGQLDFNFTHEGVITDVWGSRVEHLDHNIGTNSLTYDDVMSDAIYFGGC